MSEIDLSIVTANGQGSADSKTRTPMSDIDDALKACTFGWFHIKLLFAGFLGLVPQVLVSGSAGYILPSAECDLNMSLMQKGMLNAVAYFGMVFSTIIAGFLTDTFGRKLFILIGFGGIFIFTVIGGLSQTFEVLLTAKFFEGVLFATCFSAVLTLTSEFCHNGIRDRVMMCQSSFLAMSNIILAGLSWIILIQDWHYVLFDGKFVLNTWNFYLLILSSWSLTAFILYATMIPESPKYLLTQGKYDEARSTLINIYIQNTGKPADTYPYINIWKEKSKYDIDESDEISKSIRHQLVVGLHNIKPMFRRPLVISLTLICVMNFIVVAIYNVLRLWYPQLSTIVEHSSLVDQDMCDLLDKYTQSLKDASLNATGLEVCVPKKMGTETYINSIIIGCVCVLPYFVNGILVNKVGKKSLFIACGLIAVASTLGLRWAANKATIVALFSISISISQSLLSLSQAVTVEVFPTTTRTLAISLMMWSGRVGSLVGNIFFPILLNIGCVVPFFTISGLMSCVTIMSMFLANKK